MKIIISLLTLILSSFAAAAPINNLVVFGDSLSDNGNLYEYMQHRIPQSPPYYKGRFTNGLVWVEHLANACFPDDASARLLDYAFGGAGVSVDTDEDVLFSLKHEIDVYALAHDDKADEQSLFMVWIGANNYLALADDDEATVRDVTGGIRQGLQHLVDMGAKNILILNLPDLGITPAARDFEAQARLTNLAIQHNKALNQEVLDLKQRYPEIKWIQFDVFDAFNKILANPEPYGFNNITDTCYDVLVEKPSKNFVLKMAAKSSETSVNETCDGYLFFDPVHTTVRAHQLVASQIHEVLEANGLVFKK
jgi:phospholipase/lecithinase/hemolysin